MRLVREFGLSSVGVILLAGICFAEAGKMTLEEMIKYSNFIAVGKVVNAKVNGKRIAELEVEQVLKGDRSWKRVWFFAAPNLGLRY